MRDKDIQTGGHYLARVSGKLTTVCVVHCREQFNGVSMRWVYDVVNTATGRKLTFRSPQKFRGRMKEPSHA